MKKLKYTWVQFDKDIKKIQKIIDFSKYKSLAPVAFGGLPLGTALKNITKLPTRIIFASSYEGCKRNALKVKTGDLDKLQSPVLLVEDLTDSGATLTFISNYLTRAHIKHDTLVLFYKKGSMFKPTYFLHTVEKKIWLIMPWENK